MALDADHMTSADAARELGVSIRQVQRLADAGELTETGRVGKNLLLDSGSVHRRARRGSQRGRPWSVETAWAAVELLDEGRTARLNAAQRSRLRTRLREVDVDELVRLVRRRADLHRFRAGATVLRQLSEHVTLTGESALDAERAVAAEFDLAARRGRGTDWLDGYVARALLEGYRTKFYLADDHSGNVTLRATDDDTRARRRVASTTTVAIDLADSLDPRQRSAGRRVLNQKLRAL